MAVVKHYLTLSGRNPFSEFLTSLKDPIAKAMVLTRVARMGTYNFGDHKFCRDGVLELRIDRGIGYRVYFAKVTDADNGSINLLLLGGSKKKQQEDIARSVGYLNDFKSR